MNSCAFAACAAAITSSSVASSRPNRKFASTVPWNRYVSCITTAIRLRICAKLSVFSSRPPSRITPSCGTYIRCNSHSSVDLPEPERPTTPTRRPAAAAKLTSLSASRRPVGYANVTPSNSISALNSPVAPLAAPLAAPSAAPSAEVSAATSATSGSASDTSSTLCAAATPNNPWWNN